MSYFSFFFFFQSARSALNQLNYIRLGWPPGLGQNQRLPVPEKGIFSLIPWGEMAADYIHASYSKCILELHKLQDTFFLMNLLSYSVHEFSIVLYNIHKKKKKKNFTLDAVYDLTMRLHIDI